MFFYAVAQSTCDYTLYVFPKLLQVQQKANYISTFWCKKTAKTIALYFFYHTPKQHGFEVSFLAIK